MIDLSKVTEGGFSSLGEVLEASIVVQRAYVETRKADANVYTGMLDQARVIFAKAKELFETKGINDPEAKYYTFAADQWVAQARQEVAKGSTKGYTDAEMSLFNRYVKELYDAMSAEAPLLELDDKTGNPKLGGRSAVAKWMKDYREKKEQEQRAKSAEAAKLLGISVPGEEQAKAEEEPKAESGTVLDSLKDPKVRAAMEKYIAACAEVCEAGGANGVLKSLYAGIDAVQKHGRNSLKKGLEGLRQAAAG
jgi:hypothetical protein